MSNLVSYVFLSSDGKLKIYFEAIMAAVYCNKQQHQYMTKKYHRARTECLWEWGGGWVEV